MHYHHTITQDLNLWLQEDPEEHGQGKWEGKQKGKSDKRITESKARQKESITLRTSLGD